MARRLGPRRSHRRAVDGDVLHIAAEEQFQLARRPAASPPLDGPRDQADKLVVELIGDGPGARLEDALEALPEAPV